jgi:hypothetical protein
MEIKRVDIKEFVAFGFLHEINRLFLHPLGMALEVKICDDGKMMLNGIWDYRHDPEGMIFSEIDKDSHAKINRVKAFMDKKHKERKALLGYVFQGENSIQMGNNDDE